MLEKEEKEGGDDNLTCLRRKRKREGDEVDDVDGAKGRRGDHVSRHSSAPC